MTDADSKPHPPPRACQPFDPRTLERQLLLDAMARWGVLLFIVAAILAEPWFPWLSSSSLGDFGRALLIVLVVALWLALSIHDAKSAGKLGAATMLLEHDPEGAEDVIARTLARRPLQRSVRLLLYHRLATLRQRQQRTEESAAICQALLSRPLGKAGQVRPHLLLMFTEARLVAGDLLGAYQALAMMYRLDLTLTELLQLLAVQTRYEVAAGRYAQALDRLELKLPLIELMPAFQGGLTHRLLSDAAGRLGRDDLANWLQRRAELLCSPEQIEQFTRPVSVDAAMPAHP